MSRLPFMDFEGGLVCLILISCCVLSRPFFRVPNSGKPVSACCLGVSGSFGLVGMTAALLTGMKTMLNLTQATGGDHVDA